MGKLIIILKNNMKLILRNWALIAGVIFGVLLVIAALSNAMRSLLDKADMSSEFTLGYRIEEGSIFTDYENTLIDVFDEEDISFIRMKDNDPETTVKNGEADVFLNITKDGYKVYGSSKKEIQARIVTYIMTRVEDGIDEYVAKAEAKPEIDTQSLPYTPSVDAENYYGIIYIVYFLAIAMVFIIVLFMYERKNNLFDRYRVGNASNVTIYFGKLIPCVLVSYSSIVIVAGGLATALFDITWGNTWAALMILFLQAIAFSAFGMIFIYLFKNPVISIGVTFMFIWFAGYAGGSFESYMYSTTPENIRLLSPIYYINRTLVEYSAMGESAYLKPCIIYLSVLTVLSIAAGILLTVRERRYRT